ncbi:Alpha/Beta hydrolase protein [Cadophora sp. MPI-SDFR-AT-0126]|nr:Alpha/Beta hydrolase protein [Leotiomycetes sp. MPI-SDFR-AT-0126]
MRFFWRRTLRSGLQASAASAQPVENVSVSANNWGGASQMVAELSKEMETELGELNTSELREQKDATKARLRERSEVFFNSRINRGTHAPWNCSSETSQLAHVASICAQAVYLLPALPMDSAWSFKSVLSMGANLSGDMKATELYWAHPKAGRSVLVVAVRGSASLVDWVVNSNTQEADASDFVNTSILYGSPARTAPPLCAHRGFLNSARTLAVKLATAINAELMRAPGNVKLLFTGHSAGGAVASTLYAHFLTHLNKYSWSTLTFELSCITFGAPPIFTSDINSILQPYLDKILQGPALALITEGDPIPRMDNNHAQVLIGFLLPYDAASPPITPGGNSTRTSETSKPNPIVKKLVPSPLHGIGDIIVMADANSDSNGPLDLRLHQLGKEDLDGYLFANFFAHKMFVYKDLVAQVAAGNFNQEDLPMQIE